MFEEDYEEEFEELFRFDEEAKEESRKEFVRGCYEAYDIISTQGPAVLVEGEIPSIKNAINRMTALFLIKEEYERCMVLKRFVENHLPEFKIVPDPEIEKEFS